MILLGISVCIITGFFAANGCTNDVRGYIVGIKELDYDTCVLDLLSGPTNTSSRLSTYCTGSTSPVIKLCYNRFVSKNTLVRSRDQSHTSFATVIVFFVIASILIVGGQILVCVKLWKNRHINAEGLPRYERQVSQTTRSTVVSLEDLRREPPLTVSSRL